MIAVLVNGHQFAFLYGSFHEMHKRMLKDDVDYMFDGLSEDNVHEVVEKWKPFNRKM